MAEKWIQKAISKPGSFSAAAKRAGMSTAAYASAVLSGKIKASAQTKRRARLAKTLRRMSKRR